MQTTRLLYGLLKHLRTYKEPMDYRHGYEVADKFLHKFFDYRINGKQNIPENGPLIICSNHTSFLDMLQLGHAFYPHQISFLAKPEFFEYEQIIENFMIKFKLMPVIGYTAKKAGRLITEQCQEWGMLRIERREQTKDELRYFIKEAETKNVGIFPEGTRTRTGQLREFHSLCALLMFKTGNPIVPVGIKGTYQLWPEALYRRREVSLSIGEPILASGHQNKKDALASLEKRICELTV